MAINNQSVNEETDDLHLCLNANPNPHSHSHSSPSSPSILFIEVTRLSVVDDFKWRTVDLDLDLHCSLKGDNLKQQDFVIFHLLTYVVH